MNDISKKNLKRVAEALNLSVQSLLLERQIFRAESKSLMNKYYSGNMSGGEGEQCVAAQNNSAALTYAIVHINMALDKLGDTIKG